MQKNTDNKFQSFLWRNPDIPGIDFTKNQYTCHEFRPHFHDHFVIQLVEKGVNECICEGKKHQVTKNEIFIINPGETHTGKSFEGAPLKYLAIYPAIESLDNYLKSIDSYSANEIFFKNRITNDQELIKKFKNLFQAAHITDNKIKKDILAHDFFSYLYLNYSTRHKKGYILKHDNNKIKKAEEFIIENYSKTFSLNELSKEIAISPYHLIRMFKKEKGMTPFEFLRNIRIEKAKKILKKKGQLIDAVHETGFYDQSHFIRHFKSITGFTPKSYLC